MVLDKDEALREALRFSLETEGYRVSVFGAAADLLDSAQYGDAACFVIDEAGYDSRLDAALQDRRVPVILLSGRPDRLRKAQSGARTTIVEKPLVTDALSRRIAEALTVH